MSEHSQKTPFIKASSQDQYGKIPLKSWVGKVVSYEAQKDQIEDGWGWRYKVRILGDDSNSQNVADEQLSYAICLLPTTAGSGAAYKLRSVRVSQGDMVYGIYGGDGPRIIIGVFPRTALTDTTSGNFGTLSGFYGGLKKNGTLSDEYNGQDGPATPFTDPVGPKNYTKAEKKPTSDKSGQLGVSKAPSRNDFPRNRNGNASYLRAKRLYEESSEDVDVEKNLTPPVKVQTSEDYNESVQKGEIVVKNEETLENVTEGGLNGDIDPTVAIVANETAVKENVIEESVAEDNIKELEKKKDEFKGEKMVEVKNPEGEIILLPESVVEAGFSFQSELDKEAEEFEVGGSRYDEVHSSSSTDSESTETFTSSSSVNITYDEDTNTFTSSTVTTTSSSISGLVVGSEAPKNDTDIKLRLTSNSLTISRMIQLYDKTGNTDKSNEAKQLQRELKNFIRNNPSGYDGSSLQATLKSKYAGINY